MGIMNKTYKAAADNVYEASREYLRKQNGLTHVICFYVFSQMATQATTCDGKITDQLNQIIVAMQKDGYEILDIKMAPTLETGAITGNRRGYMATIMYK